MTYQRKFRRSLLVVAGTFLLLFTLILGMTPTAHAAVVSRYENGNTGWVSSPTVGYIWTGTVRAGETGYVTASGHSDGDPGFYWASWKCGTYQGPSDFINTRAWLVAPGVSGSATLGASSVDRYCSFYLRPDSNAVKSGRLYVDHAELRFDREDSISYPETPRPASPGPSGSQGPTPSPATPTPYAVPSGYYPCLASLAPGEYGPVPSMCMVTPSPSPTATPGTWPSCFDASNGTGVIEITSLLAQKVCLAKLDLGQTYPIGTTVHLTYSTHETASWSGHSKTGYAWLVCAADAADMASKIAALTSGSATGSCGNNKSGTQTYSGDTTSGATQHLGGANQLVTLSVSGPTRYIAIITQTNYSGGTLWTDRLSSIAVVSGDFSATPIPTATPTPAPSGSGGASASPGQFCYSFIPPSTVIAVPCPSNPGGLNGGGGGGVGPGPGSTDIPCGTGPLTGKCKPGIGDYGAGGACPFPDGSLNPLDYFAWIGCNILNIPIALSNLGQYLLNSLIDLFMPSDEFIARIEALPDAIQACAPVLWFNDLVASIESSMAGSGAPAVPNLTMTISGHTYTIFRFSDIMSALTTGVEPYRGIIGAAAYFVMIREVFNMVLSIVWQRSQPKQLEFGL